MTYDVAAFGWMLTDDIRREAFSAAVRRLVTPESRVLDLGAGTGFFTPMLALDAGAAHVTAVDIADGILDLPDAIRAAGYADRTAVYHGDVRALQTEPFDLIISDIRGQNGLCGDAFEVLADARQRLLTPGGQLIPQREQLHVAIASDPEAFREDTLPWSYLGVGRFEASERRALSATKRRQVRAEQLVSSSAMWTDIDYSALAVEPVQTVSGDVTLDIERPASMAHGLVVWFSTDLCDGVAFDTAPSDRDPVYGRLFLPFRAAALDLATTAEVRLSASYLDGVWWWDWALRAGDVRRQAGTIDARARPSAMAVDVTADQIRRDGELLHLMADGMSPSAAADAVLARHPTWGPDLAGYASKLRDRAAGPQCHRLA